MGGKINIPQFFFIFLLSTGLSNHVLIIPLLIDVAGRDAWISVIVGYLISALFMFLLVFVSRHFKERSVFEWLEIAYRPVLSRLLAICLIIFLLITGWITFKETISWTNETYLPNTPMFIIGFSILAASLYISIGKINVIAICAGVLLPFVIVFGLFVTIGTIPDKDYSLITPILVENSWINVINGVVLVFGSNIEVFLLLFLQQHIIRKINLSHLLLLTFFLSILTIGPLLGSIAVFGAEEVAALKYPAFFQWRILSIGTYFNHLDFLSIYQWLSGAFIRLALILYLITSAFNIKTKKGRLFIQSCVCVLYLIFLYVPISDEHFILFLRDYFYYGSSLFAVIVTLLIAFLVWKSKDRRNLSEK
ncbi:spore germination protein KB [Lentibacillus populi]|uniref:Spore germination protein KB n=1 Tax=Lentibacillus populi TaxID=1827502 RepID=A0A9W5TZ16_9BACI|nr:endospore germination permease [Lentibacillus populi]GGB47543.1 spore germination protein KB [Lentibacillus populi]